jgi:hypothetical protein
MPMDNIYIALVNTPGIFASLIRMNVKIPYAHVALSMDAGLREAYTFGHRNPAIPVFSGFTRENPIAVLEAFPTARYKIMQVPCTFEQKEMLRQKMQDYYMRRNKYHYCLIGLPFILAKVPFYQKRHYTCSSFIARMLERFEIYNFDKHFSLVTPRDFYDADFGETIYEGTLRNYLCAATEYKNGVGAV